MWQVIGQERAIFLLQRALERDSLSHAYLFVGPRHVGKMTMALNLAQALNCEAAERPCGECTACKKIALASHADVQVIGLTQDGNSEEAKLISIDQIRQVQHSASLPPFEGRYRVYIIEEAGLLSTEAANCLLKTLEEPVGSIIFILLTTNDGLLPATVVSRCQRLELRQIAVADVESALNTGWGVGKERARLLARLSHGCLGWAISASFDDSLIEQRREEMERLIGAIRGDCEERFAYVSGLAAQFNRSRGRVHELLDLWVDYWRDLLLAKIGLSDIITNIDRLDTIIEMAQGFRLSQIRDYIDSIQAAGARLRQNVNPLLVLEVLMLDIPGKESGSEKFLAASY